MAKPLLLMLHGVGAHSTSWADSLIKRLDEIAATFPNIATQGPFSAQVVIKPLRYDNVFDAQLDRWESQAGKVNGFVADSAVKFPRLVGLLEDNLVPSHERGFVWTGVMDAVSYRGITVTRDEVRTRMMSDVVDAINAHLATEPGADISILGHSLGTIVTHDVLQLLGTGKGGAAFASGAFRFANVFLLANATRLGPSKLIDLKSDASVVRPVSAGPPPGGGQPYCDSFYNFNNRWDPVGSWARFAPTGWGADFADVSLSHIRQVNVHGFQHYLEHPNVHVRIFRALLGNFVVPGSEWQARVAAFPDLAPSPCGTAIATLMNDLDQIRTAVNGGNLDDVAMGMVSLYRAVRTARTACPGMFNDADGQL